MLFDNSPLLHRTTRHLLRVMMLLLCTTQLASAADSDQDNRWYNVEVIIFSQKSQQFRDSERWPVDVSLPDEANARSLRPAVRGGASLSNSQAFSLIPSNKLTLNSEAARIRKAPELEMLLHTGWRQPGLPEDQAVSVSVHAGTLDTPDQPYRMEGTLKLVLSRYLHIYADLLYREPMPESATSETSTDAYAGPAAMSSDAMPRYRIYRLQQSRRMRSGELHYIDNPVLGMIIRVTPI